MKTLPVDLKRFRYINGSIFRDPLPPATFDRKMREALITVSREFDWTQISPSIFGAMFQGVMDPQARRTLGAHYTSRENILRSFARYSWTRCMMSLKRASLPRRN